jgi:hypothetical protein
MHAPAASPQVPIGQDTGSVCRLLPGFEAQTTVTSSAKLPCLYVHVPHTYMDIQQFRYCVVTLLLCERHV